MKKIWLTAYPKTVPAEINLPKDETLVDLFAASFRQFATLPAFYNLGRTLSYEQIEIHSRYFAAYLQQVLKLPQGARVAIMMPNLLQYPVVMLGVLRAGLIVVNVNPLYTAPELTHQLSDAGAETIIVLENYAHVVQQALPNTLLKNIIVTRVGDMLSCPKACLIHFVLKYIKQKIPAWHLPNAKWFKTVCKEARDLTFTPPNIKSDDLAFLQYTGGTTGVAKGAMLTHQNLVANILQAEAWLTGFLTPGKEIMITALPLYHVFSLMANALLMMKVGALNVLITDPRDVGSMIKEMARFSFTAITGVNTLFKVLLNHPRFAALNFSALKFSLGGGMTVSRTVAEHWQAVTHNVLIEAYGLTEASPAVLINPMNLSAYNGFVGLPIPSTEVCFLDDDGQEVPLGEPGELAIKGPQVMKGYWKQPLETAKVFTAEGWLLSGDTACMNAEGFVKILERKKDMIIVSGFNVYPTEIEEVLLTMPEIKEAAVIGVKDERTGEAVKAVIVKKDPALTKEAVIAFCHANLTGYKIPRHIEFIEELPKTPVGKILRRALR